MLRLLLFVCVVVLSGFSMSCANRVAAARVDSVHFNKLSPEEHELLVRNLLSFAEEQNRFISGPLTQTVKDYLAYHIANIGPLMYQTKSFTDAQLKRAEELPAVVAQHVREQLNKQLDQLLVEVERFGRRYTEDELPLLAQNYARFVQSRRDEVDRFVTQVKQYGTVNTQMLDNLWIDIDSYFAWQKKVSKNIPVSVERYIARVAGEREMLMNSGARMLEVQLSENPKLLMKDVQKNIHYNMDELLPQLRASVGKYLWERQDIPEITKELHSFVNNNIKATGAMVNNVQSYFSFQNKNRKEAIASLEKFLKWRNSQWHDMRVAMNKYLSVQIYNYNVFKRNPLRYIRHQQEEFEELKKVVPRYFRHNISEIDGLALALRRFIEFNIGGGGGH